MKKLVFLFFLMTGTVLLSAQTPQRTVQSAQAATKTFVLTDGKLGSVQVGQKFANIPATFAGLYDKYTRKVETMADMDGEWTVEYYLFTLAGKAIFRVDVDDNKTITMLTLQSGSSAIVKTQEGFSVGYPVRSLFAKKRMEWSTYYDGEAFATSGHYTYKMSSDDLINTDIPQNANQVKPTAKLTAIIYSAEMGY